MEQKTVQQVIEECFIRDNRIKVLLKEKTWTPERACKIFTGIDPDKDNTGLDGIELLKGNERFRKFEKLLETYLDDCDDEPMASNAFIDWYIEDNYSNNGLPDWPRLILTLVEYSQEEKRLVILPRLIADALGDGSILGFY
jgi:hypothetical protein